MKYLSLLVLLAACGPVPVPDPAPAYLRTASYVYAVGPTSTVVSVRHPETAGAFCVTARSLGGLSVCNNLTAGSRAVPYGAGDGAVFTEAGTVAQ